MLACSSASGFWPFLMLVSLRCRSLNYQASTTRLASERRDSPSRVNTAVPRSTASSGDCARVQSSLHQPELVGTGAPRASPSARLAAIISSFRAPARRCSHDDAAEAWLPALQAEMVSQDYSGRAATAAAVMLLCLIGTANSACGAPVLATALLPSPQRSTFAIRPSGFRGAHC